MSKKIVASAVAAACVAMVPQAVVAQDSGEGRLDEIVVTAQKREQRLQDVPIAVSVVSGALAEASGSFNIEALKTLVPSLNIRKTNTSLNQSLFLRGVGTINFAIAAQPSVATVLDGVVLSSAGEAFGDLYDIERIEVLRGPQGTLFGKNASAGVVNIVSKRPGDTTGGYIDVGWYEDNELRVKGAIDMPISDTVRSRTTVTYGKFDGYISNISTTAAGGDLNGYDRKGIRTVWEIGSEGNLWTFSGDYRKSDDNCCVEIIGNAPTGANAAAYTSLYSGIVLQGDKTRQVKQDLQMRSTEEAWGLSLQGDIDTALGSLTSITAYRTWDATEYREGDWIDQAAPYVGNAFAQLHDFGPQTTKTFSQELRLASSGDGAFNYVAGVYYSNTESERFFQRNIFNCTASTLAIDATGQRPCRAGSSTYVSTFSNATFGADFKNTAVFADGTWNVTDSLRLIGGARWTQDKLSYFHNRVPTPFAGQPGIRTDLSGFKGSNDSDNVSGRAGLQYDLNDDVMVYASYARGYKGPAYNVFFNMTVNNTPVIEAETADSYELGLKSTLLDGRMLVNAAVFDAKYDDFQANNFLFLNGTLITTLTNAGKVSSKGFELDVQARPNDMLTFGAGVAYTDAKVDNFFTPPGQNSTVRAGTSLPLAPEWKASLNGDLNIPMGSYTVVPSMVMSYQGTSFADLNEPAALRIPGYTTVDLTIAVRDESDRFRIALVGRNLADKSFTVLKTGGGPGGAPRLQIPRDAERYFGIQARFNFGAK
ncbi:MAG: TonB-dependent receptor [Gammaproteobacteria bacterium]|nr:TonB-dependent receptor [Gammaproteobacteria bacterium]